MYGLLRTSLICLILLGSALLSYGETKAPSKSSAPEMERSVERAQNTDIRGTKESPLSIELLNTGKSKDEAEREAKHEENKSFREIVLNIFTGILAVATASLAIITGFLVRYTKKLWATTGDLVTETKETAKEELRAYMGVERIRVYQDSADTSIPGDWNIKIRNFGKTMAKDTEVWIAGAIGDGRSDFLLGDRRSKTVVMPNEAMGFEEAIGKIQENIDLFRKGSAWVYVWGKIVYKDVFGKDHWTIFRFKSTHAAFSSESMRREWKVRTDGEGANDAN